MINEFHTLLNWAQVSTSCWGTRMIYVGSYDGDITIKELSRIFKEKAPPNFENQDKYDRLWKRIQRLYNEDPEPYLDIS